MCCVPEKHYLIFRIMTASREHSSPGASWFPPTAYQENIGSRMPTETDHLDAVTLITDSTGITAV